MSCQQAKESLHEYMDGELRGQETLSVRAHLEVCENCRRHLDELLLIQGAMAIPVALPGPSQQLSFRRLDARSRRGWLAPLAELLDYSWTYWRDLDKNVVRAKLLAVPLSLMFFFTIADQFPERAMQAWTYSVFHRSHAGQQAERPVMVQVLQPSRAINDLVDAAWRIPYEDSLSVLAEIDSFGGASIGDILEYPKNSELLEKVGRTLEQARFDFGQGVPESFIIYSFQKVDVYEGRGF